MHRTLTTIAALTVACAAHAEGPPCPPGWDGTPTPPLVAQCIAPIGTGLIEVTAYPSVMDKTFREAMYGFERLVGSDGTPLDNMIAEQEIALGESAAYQRDYTGPGPNGQIRVRLILTRVGDTDLLALALWGEAFGAVYEPMISASLADWTPTAPD